MLYDIVGITCNLRIKWPSSELCGLCNTEPMWNISIHLWCTYREMLVIAQFTMVKFTQRFSQYISTQHSQGFKTFPEITIPSTIHTNLYKRKFLNEEKFVVWILSLYLLSNVPVSEIPMISSRRLLLTSTFILDRHQGWWRCYNLWVEFGY